MACGLLGRVGAEDEDRRPATGAGSARTARSTSKPDPSGRWMSSRISAGRSAAAAEIPPATVGSTCNRRPGNSAMMLSTSEALSGSSST